MKAYSWLAYPIGVFLTIVVTASFLFGSDGVWAQMGVKQEKVAQQAELANQLRSKLARLQNADLAQESQNLSFLLQVLPSQKDLASLLAEIQVAASTSGAIFSGFSGRVGEVTASESATLNKATDSLLLEATLTVADIAQLQQFLSSLEKSIPLVSVQSVKFANGKATLIVEGMWHPLAKLPAGGQYQIVDNSSDLTALKGTFSNFSTLLQFASSAPASDINPAPFQ